jgi:hypothetical protein
MAETIERPVRRAMTERMALMVVDMVVLSKSEVNVCCLV